MQSTLVVLLSALCLAAGQTIDGRCERFDQSPGVCRSVLVGSWQQVWTAPHLGLSQEYYNARMYDAAVSNEQQFVAYLDVLSSQLYSTGCAQAYAQLLCPTFFPPCLSNADGSVAPIPVCRSVCETVNAVCGPLLDCVNATNPLTGQPRWPADSPQCTSQPDNATIDNVAYACPPPMRFTPRIPDEYSHTACSTTCKRKLTFLSSMQEFWSLWWIITVCSWLSFVLVIVLMVTVVLFPSLRRYPNRLVFHQALSFFVFHLGTVGASFTGTDYICNSETQLASGIGYCGFYAWCIYFGGLLASLWWAFQTFVIFYQVALGHHNNLDAKLEKFAVPAFTAYALAASLALTTVDPQAVGNRGAVPFCFNSMLQPAWHLYLTYGLFHSVLIVCALLVSTFIILTLASLLRRASASTMKGSIAQFCAVMGIFCVYFLITIASVLAVAFTIEANRDAYRDGIAQWHQCVFSWRIDTSDCPLPKANNNINRWEITMLSMCGTFLFVCFFVLRERTWRCWAVALSNVANGRPFFHDSGGHESTFGQRSSTSRSSTSK